MTTITHAESNWAFVILVYLHQTLYDYGARKFVLIGVGQIGCSPNALAQNSADGRTCAQNINAANQLFNNRLRGLVDEFNGNTPDAKFIYINAYDIFQDLIDNPSAFGKIFFSLILCVTKVGHAI